MKNFRRDFERFCLRNRNKGIPNLMLYIILGSGAVFLLSMFNGGEILYEWLRFDKAAILRGQVWRLFTYVLTYTPGANQFMVIIGLYFFYHLSRTVEMIMGTFRFNLFYFSGVILMDVFAMIFCPVQDVIIGEYLVPPELFTSAIYSDMAWFLHLSLLLFYAAYSPDSEFLVLSAVMELKLGDENAIRARVAELMAKRKEKQPLEWPSAGSTFKRPEGYFAAALIDQCGLKGLSLGGAQVSEKHAGFVINTGDATCSDILALMNQVRERVLAETGVTLEPEVKYLR